MDKGELAELRSLVVLKSVQMGAVLSALEEAELFQLLHPSHVQSNSRFSKHYTHFPYRNPVWIAMHDIIVHAQF